MCLSVSGERNVEVTADEGESESCVFIEDKGICGE